MITQVLTWLSQPIRRFWRGEVGLWSAILVYLLGLCLLLNSVQELAGGMADGLVFVLVAFCCGPVLIWQGVGLIRTCSTHLTNGGDVFLTWAGYSMLLVVIAMTLSQSVGSVLATRYFQPEPVVEAGPVFLPLRADGRTAELSGDIDYQRRDALHRTLAEQPQVTRIVLQSNGGLVYAARNIAQIIEAQRLDTHVEGVCSSACTLVFAAGRNRTMGSNAKLGFHAYGKVSKFHLLSVDAEEEQDKDAAFLRRRGISEAFLAKIYAGSIDTLWQPDRQELIEAGVLTAP